MSKATSRVSLDLSTSGGALADVYRWVMFCITLVTRGQLYHDLSQTEPSIYPNLSQVIPRSRAVRRSEEAALSIGGPGALGEMRAFANWTNGQDGVYFSVSK